MTSQKRELKQLRAVASTCNGTAMRQVETNLSFLSGFWQSFTDEWQEDHYICLMSVNQHLRKAKMKHQSNSKFLRLHDVKRVCICLSISFLFQSGMSLQVYKSMLYSKPKEVFFRMKTSVCLKIRPDFVI